MSKQGQFYYVAQAYGQGTYGSCTYSATTSCTTSSGGGGTSGSTAGNSSSGGLVNTGVAVVAFVTLACLIIFVAMVVRFWKRSPKAKPEVQEVESDNDTSDNTRE